MKSKRFVLKTIIIIIAILAAICVIVFVEPFSVRNQSVKFSMKVSTCSADDYLQVYYAFEGDAGYSEGQSIITAINEGTNNISIELPQNVKNIRVDMGDKIGEYYFEDIFFEIGKEEFRPSDEKLNLINSINSMDSFAFINGRAKIIVTGDDPFFEWNLSVFNFDSIKQTKCMIYNVLLKAIFIVIIILLVYQIIKRYSGLCDYLSQVYISRDIIIQLAKNDFKNRFAGAYFGVVWAFVQPVITILVYWFAFEKGLHASGVSNVPYVLWLISGLVPWFFFSEALNGGTQSLLEYQYLVKKVVFQIEVLPIVKLISAFFINVTFLFIMIILFALYGYWPGAYIIQVIYYYFCDCVLVLGLSYITASFVIFFRDLSQIISIILQIGIWVTPILWNIDTMNVNKTIKILMQLNPFYYISNGFRDSLIGHIGFWNRPILSFYFWIFAIIQLGGGILLFRRLKGHFADII